MTVSRLSRLTGLAALIAVPLYVVAFALQGKPPGEHASGAQVLAYAVDHRGALLVAVYLTGVALALAICFQVGLAAHLTGEGIEDRALAVVGVAGGITWIGIVFMGIVCLSALAYRGAAGDPGTARTLMDLSLMSLVVSAYATVVNVVAFSLLMLRRGVFPHWIAWLGCLAGAAHLVAGAGFAHDGLMAPSLMAETVAPVLYLLWAAATGTCLLLDRTGRPVGTSTTNATQPSRA